MDLRFTLVKKRKFFFVAKRDVHISGVRQNLRFSRFSYRIPRPRRVGCSPRGDVSWHAVGRHGLKREVVHSDGRGLRVSDGIYQSSKTEVEQPSDRAPVADRSGGPSGGETKLSCLCGLPFSTGCPPHSLSLQVLSTHLNAGVGVMCVKVFIEKNRNIGKRRMK